MHIFHRNKYYRTLLLSVVTNIQSQFKYIFRIFRICVLVWKRNMKRVLSPYPERIRFSGVVLLLSRSLNNYWCDVVSLKKDWSTLNIDAAQTKWLLLYRPILHRSSLGFDWSYHRYMVWTTSWCAHEQKKRKQLPPSQLINFTDIHNPFKVPVNELINIATGVILSHDINVDSAVDKGTKFVFGLNGKLFGEISLKRKDQAKTLAKN